MARQVLKLEEGTTNLVANPSAETGLTRIFASDAAGAPITRITATPWVGTGAVQCVANGAAALQGILYYSLAGVGGTAVRTFIGSLALRGAGTVSVFMSAVYSDLTTTVGAVTNVTAGAGWTRVTTPPITTVAGKTLDVVVLHARTATAQAVTFVVDGAHIEQKPYATSYADGALGTGYAWTGAAHASASTRAAASLQLPAASFPASLALKYSEDDGQTWQHAYLTAPGGFGTRGQVSYAGGVITIAPTQRAILLAGVRGDARALSASEKARLEAQETWSWTGLLAG